MLLDVRDRNEWFIKTSTRRVHGGQKHKYVELKKDSDLHVSDGLR